MSGDAHVRICESLGVKFPRATRLVVVIRGRQFYLWRAVDSEGEVLDFLVQSLPIRLTPMTATCRVPPLSRVKLRHRLEQRCRPRCRANERKALNG